MLTDKELRQVNKELRQDDESHLWPICGRFNVTERAIRQCRRLMREGLAIDSAMEYESTLDMLISEIVNDERNW